MKISIITVCYNSEKTIRKTIESVLNQTFQPFEYFIVDGKSCDRTIDIACGYKAAFQKKGIAFHIISEKDNGLYDAMNKGVSMSHGDIIGMINSDDWYEEDALKTVADTFQKTPFDMMYADIRLHRADGSTIFKKARLRKIITSRDWNHPTTFIRRGIYQKFQYDIQKIYADFDMLIRIRKSGFKVIVINKVLANFTLGGVSNEKSWSGFRKRFACRYRCYKDNGCSRLYILECLAIEIAKLIAA